MPPQPFLRRALERAEHRNSELQARVDAQRRLAADLHDDLGPPLLALVQAGRHGAQPERVASLARQALQDMRLSVRGLTGPGAVDAADVLADWRAETVERLADAGVQAQWDAPDPSPALPLPARTVVQLTRILREAVGNVIRHSGARQCAVRIRFDGGLVRIEVMDDGRGIAAAEPRAGLGLAQVERRARQLDGVHRLDTGPLGGVRLLVQVPLQPLAQEA